jgi:serine/threonine protein kinase
MTIKQIEGYSIYMNKILGKGSYGSVYISRREQNGEQVAVKILPKENSKYSFIQSITMTI